jgi:ribosomal protein S18 acetylase RimI-like enzyme
VVEGARLESVWARKGLAGSNPAPSVAMIMLATTDDAVALAALHNEVAARLTDLHGEGPWSAATTDKGMLYAMRTSRVYVARERGKIVATFRLATKKPWAIDNSYFAAANRPLYLLGMAVLPERQRQGVGRRCLAEATGIAREWPADAIRLDAWDADAGAAGFYARCGYTEVGRKTYRTTPLIYFELRLDSNSAPESDSPGARRPSRS